MVAAPEVKAPPAIMAPLPIDELRKAIGALSLQVADLEDTVRDLKTREKKHWAKSESFMSKFGTYYNRAGQHAMFIVHSLTTGGANGIALTPNQGAIEEFALEIKIPKDGEKVIGPCWVPEIIPEKVAPEVELFTSVANGTDNKVNS